MLAATPFEFVGWPSFLGVACPAAAMMFLAALSGKLVATMVAAPSFSYGAGWPYLSKVASPVLMWAAFSGWVFAGCDAAETEFSGAKVLGNRGLLTSAGCDVGEYETSGAMLLGNGGLSVAGASLAVVGASTVAAEGVTDTWGSHVSFTSGDQGACWNEEASVEMPEFEGSVPDQLDAVLERDPWMHWRPMLAQNPWRCWIPGVALPVIEEEVQLGQDPEDPEFEWVECEDLLECTVQDDESEAGSEIYFSGGVLEEVPFPAVPEPIEKIQILFRGLGGLGV